MNQDEQTITVDEEEVEATKQALEQAGYDVCGEATQADGTVEISYR